MSGEDPSSANVPSDEVASDRQDRASLVVRMADLRPRLIKSLRDHQPLIILASLMLVLAGFIRDFSEETAALAATSAVVFVIALVASLLEDLTKETNVAWLSLTFLGIAVGFVLLAFVAFTLVRSFTVGFLLFSVVLNGAVIFAFGVITLGQAAFYMNSFRSLRVSRRIQRAALLFTMIGVSGWAILIGVAPAIIAAGAGEIPVTTTVAWAAGFLLALTSIAAFNVIVERYVPNR